MAGSVFVSTNTRAPAIGSFTESKTRPETLPFVEPETGQPAWLIGGNVVPACVEGGVVVVVVGRFSRPTGTLDLALNPEAGMLLVIAVTLSNSKPAISRFNRRVSEFTSPPIQLG
jgi:hypothetical protein